MMLNTLIYLFEVSVLTSVLYLFYRYLYFKLSYFVWSRYYLYAVLFFSLIIPVLPGLFNYETIATNVFQLVTGAYSGKINGLIKINQSFITENHRWLKPDFLIKAIIIIWISGICRFIFSLIKTLYSVRKIIKNGQKTKTGHFTIVKSDFHGSVFSFFKFIFINNEFELLEQTEKEHIIKHEKIHGEQLHSLDNLIFELFRAVFWFNPVSKLIAADIKIVHEFIVDNVLTGNKNKPDYSKLIVKLSAAENTILIGSNFSKEEIKNRIKLISFPEKEKIRKRRFIVSVPVLILTLFVSWFIISSANNYLKTPKKPDTIFSKPFDKNTSKIISPYFTNKLIDGIPVSHKECSYEVQNFSNIYAVGNGIITNIKTKDIFGLKEITIFEKLTNGYLIEYSGIYQSLTNLNESVEKGECIAKSGDIRLYPTINIKISKNGKTVNPEKLY